MTRHHGVALMLAAATVALAMGAGSGQAAPTDPASLRPSFLKFTVSNLPAMQAFYEKAFGMTQQKRLDNPGSTEVILTSPSAGADLALVFYKDGRKVSLGNANGPIGFYLQDVDSAYTKAMAAGATSRTAPRTGGDARVAVVADPEGHDIELLHLN
ncbi:MAG TPA: VOC family protein [Caulobacteraceae bacterium]